ncbi:helix-turn-helix transcriptional regulator [Lentilactobacillus sp. Marseille-Q4993]|uniref:helix-turn-helix domain-containing protein n=1 Tax=Lentilactobacillus sp. Marseille-Q4993 TaxID=3039492 RepID=UPI0024BC1DCD|nr:helix-turn-helix transcriptional regulator [Lentilactobacillus sp. Marseille-Q4993]
MEISKVIQKHRQRLGLSQQNLADKLMISRQSISKWERGTALPSFANVVALSDLFGISLDEMIRGDDRLMSKLEQGKMGPITKILVWSFGIAVPLCILLAGFGMGATTLDNITSVLLFFFFIALICTVKWNKLKSLFRKPTQVLIIICLVLFLLPQVYRVPQILNGWSNDIRTGFDEGSKSVK